jgi:hypothetical protein
MAPLYTESQSRSVSLGQNLQETPAGRNAKVAWMTCRRLRSKPENLLGTAILGPDIFQGFGSRKRTRFSPCKAKKENHLF